MSLRPICENERFAMWRITSPAGMQDLCLDRLEERWVASVRFGEGTLVRDPDESDEDFQVRAAEFVAERDLVLEDGSSPIPQTPSPSM